ncbi:MAG: NUDIX hydrolase [Candidatus Cloacimonetes bacterium]|nr:NUDIX hydrolase [Candidatus Cloacimonadota bacterium]
MRKTLKQIVKNLDLTKTSNFCPQCLSENVGSKEVKGRLVSFCNDCSYKSGQLIIFSPEMRFELTKDGQIRHFSIGAVIPRDGRYLLFKRRKFPYVWVSPAGHWDKGEEAEQAIKREVEEEAGLRVKKVELLFEEDLSNDPCRRGTSLHHWKFFLCECEGKLQACDEAEPSTIGFYAPSDIARMELSNPTKYFFEKMGVI